MLRAFVGLLCLAWMAGIGGSFAADAPSHRYSVAVIIGNKTYQGRIPEVAYAHRDADAMKAYLTQVLGYREGNIIDLRDATKAELEAAFGNAYSHEGKVWRFMRPGRSHVTVFYSGHGVPGLKDKRGYILPVNADPNTPEINGYPVDLLYKNLAALEAESVTVYLDACFSGESDQGMLIRSASPVYVQSKMPETKGGLTVLTAASANQVASWDEENKHGLFTWHLLRALQGEADQEPFGDGDGRVTVAETKAYLDEEMTYVARRRFGRVQNASVQGTGDELLGVVTSTPSAPPAAEQPKVAALAPSFDVSDLDQTMVVAGARVNVRSGPGTEFEKVATLDGGADIEVTGKVEGKNWYRVALAGGGSGYVFGTLLSDRAPAPAQPVVGTFPATLSPGDSFKDCDVCPEMVVVPAGTFLMGSPSYEKGRNAKREGPVHRVRIERPFAIGKFEVTKAEYAEFVTTTGYSGGSSCKTTDGTGKWEDRSGRSWHDPGYRQSDREPVVCVSWQDASAYLEWLSRKTGKTYRLPSEAEWEYAARAGTTTARSWGEAADLACRFANVHDQTSASTNNFSHSAHECDDGFPQTAPVGSYSPNAFGLHDMIGNVGEYVEDCWTESYTGAPADGSARLDGDCTKRIIRASSWSKSPAFARSAGRAGADSADRYDNDGFRVALPLD